MVSFATSDHESWTLVVVNAVAVKLAGGFEIGSGDVGAVTHAHEEPLAWQICPTEQLPLHSGALPPHTGTGLMTRTLKGCTYAVEPTTSVMGSNPAESIPVCVLLSVSVRLEAD